MPNLNNNRNIIAIIALSKMFFMLAVFNNMTFNNIIQLFVFYGYLKIMNQHKIK